MDAWGNISPSGFSWDGEVPMAEGWNYWVSAVVQMGLRLEGCVCASGREFEGCFGLVGGRAGGCYGTV
jgi:hypothetical protein